ncbi:MAG: hypothetical protein JO171_20330 [Paludibacterium sp.]|uniref:hypothetical protein n=1 Tax=Paludibacterium sp. TaxID=1917523 RepID=UPI0025E7931F|nr:hypothetical protein [Paludibacterium sp.]MBV8049501.1 hypothetical protein [Paludibacterium sp.]MBV8646238.1 hypothetical protein [Paludibacterium sp.]
MYDCQTDACTDFSFAFFDAVGCARPLAGTLTATPATPTDADSLATLAAYADGLGYPVERHDGAVIVREVSLPDALAINARFGNQLIISCDLRRDPPVRFG